MRTSNRARIASALLALIAASCQPEAAVPSSDPSSEHKEPPVDEFDSGVAVSSNALITGNIAPVPFADTVLRSGVPFGNDGLGQVLGVTSASVADVKRSIVRFNEAQMKAPFPAGRVLQSARLDLVVTGISAGWLGGAIDIHAMNREWVEGTGLFGNGASWVCANDTNTTLLGNLVNNCSAANNWSMTTPAPFQRPFNPTATDRVPVFTGGLTTISFDVTEDVRAVRNGGKHYGWMLAGAPNLAGGLWVNFGSRETLTAKPKLTVFYGTDDCPTDPNKGLVGACGCGNPDLDTNLDNVADCFDTVVPATGDTALRLAAPFANDGNGLFLPTTAVSVIDIERSLVKVSNAAIDAARTGRPIEKAYLELTVAGIALGWAGGQVAVHRMNAAPDWVEGIGLAGYGASWSCAYDYDTTLLGNVFNHCVPSDDWYMSPLQWTIFPKPYIDPPTGVAGISWPGVNSIRVDVTADVQAFLADPSSNNGWIIQGQASNFFSGNWVNFGSRESGAPPRLLLELPAACPSTGKPAPGACGCAIPETDSDGDGTPDCIDECPQNNPQIVRGACGCGVQPDDDSDGLPNCIDPCPEDDDPTLGGECGCPSDVLAPEGTACVGACGGSGDPSGFDECDGDGHCGAIGNAAECPSPDPTCPGCTPYLVKNLSLGTPYSIYWHCPCPRSGDFARDACDDVVGHHLARIETGEQNAFVRSLIDSDTWLGGNDQSSDGAWYWTRADGLDGTHFWSGGPSGNTVGSAYANWQTGEPAGGGGENCAAMSFASTTGEWQDRSCGQALDFVCERGLETTDSGGRVPETIETCLYLGNRCPPPDRMCIDDAALPGGTREQQEEQLNTCDDCTAACPGGDDPTPEEQDACREACEDLCEGAALPPNPATAVPCEVMHDYDLTPTPLPDGQPEPEKRCPIQTPEPPDTYEDFEPCVNHEQCEDNTDGRTHCGEAFHCRDCDPSLDGGESCLACVGELDPMSDYPPPPNAYVCPSLENRCVAKKYCGVPVPQCFLDDDDDLLCEQIELCIDPENEHESQGPDDEEMLEEVIPFNPEAAFDIPPIPPPDPFFPEDEGCSPAPCAGPTDESHPWCHYVVTEGLSDQRPDSLQKPVETGDGSILSFNVEPGLNLVYETELGPLGMPLPLIAAEASFVAKAGIRIFGMDHDLTLINLAAGARGGIHDAIDIEDDVCGFKAYARADVLGMDVLPERIDFRMPDMDGTTDLQQECLEAVGDFRTVVDSARKSFADARELVRQYNALKEDGLYFSDGTGAIQSLCEQIAASPPRGFPVWGACKDEKPVDTINRFIAFYNFTVIGNVRAAADDLGQRLDALVAAQGLNVEYPIFTPVHEDEQITLFNTTFLIGPVPCNLEVLMTAQYGYGAALLAELRAGQLMGDLVNARYLSGHPIFKVGLNGGPSAGVGLSLFAGVGFDLGFAKAKLGIEGAIDLGHVRLPVYAWAGIGVTTKPDLREPPESWAETLDLDAGYLIPTQRLSFDLMYGYGADLAVDHVLSGSLALALKIKFFFFSKSWRKKIISFSGLCPTGAGRQAWCDIPLFTSAGQTKTQWGEIQLPMPFYPIKPLPTWPADPTGGTEDFDTAVVGELFYDSLCQCIDPWDDDNPPKGDCYRNEDCCGWENDPTLVCYVNPELVDGVERGQCTGCRPEGENCRKDDDCCDKDDNSCFKLDSDDEVGECRPKSGSCGSCVRQEDCIEREPPLDPLVCSPQGNCVIDADWCVLQ